MPHEPPYRRIFWIRKRLRRQATLSNSQPSTLYLPDPRTPPEHSHSFGLWAPGLGSFQTLLPLPASPPLSHSARVTSRLTLTSRRGGGSPGAFARRARGLAEPGGGGCHLGRRPQQGHRGPAPCCLPEPIQLQDQFWPRPQTKRGGEEPRLLPTLFAVPGGSRETPCLGSKRSRCTGRKLAARRAQAGDVEGPSIRGLGLPPDLFT